MKRRTKTFAVTVRRLLLWSNQHRFILTLASVAATFLAVIAWSSLRPPRNPPRFESPEADNVGSDSRASARLDAEQWQLRSEELQAKLNSLTKQLDAATARSAGLTADLAKRETRLRHRDDQLRYSHATLDDLLNFFELEASREPQSFAWLGTLEGYLAADAADSEKSSQRDIARSWRRLARCRALQDHRPVADSRIADSRRIDGRCVEAFRRSLAAYATAEAEHPEDATLTDEWIRTQIATGAALSRNGDSVGAAVAWRQALTRIESQPGSLAQAYGLEAAKCRLGLAAASDVAGETAAAVQHIRSAEAGLIAYELPKPSSALKNIDLAALCLRTSRELQRRDVSAELPALLRTARTSLQEMPNAPALQSIARHAWLEYYDVNVDIETAAGRPREAAVASREGLAILAHLDRRTAAESFLAGKLTFHSLADAPVAEEERGLRKADAILELCSQSSATNQTAVELRMTVLRRLADLHRFRGDLAGAERELNQAAAMLETSPLAAAERSQLLRLRSDIVEIVLASGTSARADRMAEQLLRQIEVDSAAMGDKPTLDLAAARCRILQAEASLALGDRGRAKSLVATALPTLDRELRERPSDFESSDLKARASWLAAEATTDPVERLRSVDEGIAIWERLVESDARPSFDRVHYASALRDRAERAKQSVADRILLADRILVAIEPKPGDLYDAAAKAAALDIRAAALAEQGKWQAAVDDWRLAVETSPNAAWRLRLNQARAGLRKHDDHAAAEAAAAVRRDPSVPREALLEVARVYVLSAMSLRSRATEGRSLDEAVEDRYIAQAFEVLESARVRGVFDEPQAVKQLDDDPDFLLLRGRIEYSHFVERLRRSETAGRN